MYERLRRILPKKPRQPKVCKKCIEMQSRLDDIEPKLIALKYINNKIECALKDAELEVEELKKTIRQREPLW